MVDLTLEEFQRNQSVQISRDIIGQSEEHEQKMQTNAQKLWENAHKQLVSLLRVLDQDYDESCEKATRPLESFNDDDLAYLIHIRLRALQGDASKKAKPNEIIEVKRSMQELTQKYSDLEQTLLATQDLNKKLLAEKSALEAHLSALRQVQKDVVSLDIQLPNLVTDNPGTLTTIPDWIKTWKESKTFEKTSTAILVMGDKGKALRPSIIKMMATRLSLLFDNNNLDSVVSRLLTEEEGQHPILIEKVQGIPGQGSSSGGITPDVLRLNADGIIAYRVLSGHVAAENEYDRLLRHHSSPEHTILNIQAAETLQEAGYTIKEQAQEIILADGGTFIPDIIAANRGTGELIFIEVERDVHKDQMARKQKWMNLYEASNGNLYVFCDNLTCQRAIQGEINLALGGLKFNSNLTNLHGIRNGKRSEIDGGIWLSMKRSN